MKYVGHRTLKLRRGPTTKDELCGRKALNSPTLGRRLKADARNATVSPPDIASRAERETNAPNDTKTISKPNT